MASLPEVYVARHGETAWTRTGQHTGRIDIPLTARRAQCPGPLPAAPRGHVHQGAGEPACAGPADVRVGRLRRPSHAIPSRGEVALSVVLNRTSLA